MALSYTSEKLGIAVQVQDVHGDFISTLSEVEREVLGIGIKDMLSGFVAAIKFTRQGKESQDGLEG